MSKNGSELSHSEATREGIAKRRREARVRPCDFDRLRRDGEIEESIRPLLELAQTEAIEIADSLGGVAELSAQEAVIVQDLARLGVLTNSLFAMYARKPHPDIASRIGTLVGHRRGHLQALGIKRRARAVGTVAEYIAARAREAEAASESTISIDPDPSPSSAAGGGSEGEHPDERS